MSSAQILLAVQNALTEEERTRILEHAARANPHLRGMHVADWLQMCYDRDAFLTERETLAESGFSDVAGEYDDELASAAAIAVASLHSENILDLAGRAQEIVQAAAASLGPETLEQIKEKRDATWAAQARYTAEQATLHPSDWPFRFDPRISILGGSPSPDRRIELQEDKE